jgi:hypothetical protein
MKTFVRILIILMVFTITMGITYTVVNASSSSSPTSALTVVRGEGFARPTGERPEMDDGGMRGSGWLLGMVKNLGIVAIIVVLITVPKSLMRRKVVPIGVG